MSDDNESGPYRRDKQGFRTAPGDPNRQAYWWELAVSFGFRYFWVLLAVLVGLFIWFRMHGTAHGVD